MDDNLKQACGQPAHPYAYQTINMGNGVSYQGHTGTTLLDYYLAHAPEKPWKHFEPAMPPKPVDTCTITHDTGDQVVLHSEVEVNQYLSDHGLDYEACEWNMDAQDDWELRYMIERIQQWPMYWALTMIQQREAVLGP